MVKFLIINELSMVSIDLWTDSDSRLGEIFMMISEEVIAGLSLFHFSLYLICYKCPF